MEKAHVMSFTSPSCMKVLTARTDVSYLRDYKQEARRGMRGVFVPSGSFCFSATPPLLYHQCVAFVFLLGYAGLPLVLRV